MSYEELVEKTRQKFANTSGYLDQSSLMMKKELKDRLMTLNSLIRELIEKETDQKRVMYLFYALMYVDSAIDNLDYTSPEHDSFAVYQAKWAVRKAFEIFTELFKDNFQSEQ
ncbi:hypothetical protein [Acidianus bottle-shaped virus 2 strain ABV2]|uniref:Uncharacterized protein n=1 Tax=Acidianus bottle-shaped virus 2 strain ABV2 TaxID=1732173 RepID=A0A0N9NI21_9VIRU|nr:hypothetical protein AVU01_gp02 [Acidianus bottle-shaped virus 2 strain ABV2]ALG96750.1 hypothetical protein [Acidianus bottle-shaped virus 2 strain ABV2]